MYLLSTFPHEYQKVTVPSILSAFSLSGLIYKILSSVIENPPVKIVTIKSLDAMSIRDKECLLQLKSESYIFKSKKMSARTTKSIIWPYYPRTINL